MIKTIKKTSKRDIILLAAKEAFREYGVDNTSMDKLSALANVSKSTVYQYFSSKETLVVEVLSLLWQESIDKQKDDLVPHGTVNAQLEYLLLSEINVFTSEEYLNLSKVTLGHFLYSPIECKEKERLRAMFHKETALFRWLTKMVDDGILLISNIEHAEEQLQSLICNPAYWCQAIGIAPLLTDDEKQQLVQRTADLFLRCYQVPNSSNAL